MKLFYRVENEAGVGPYQCNGPASQWRAINNIPQFNPRHPVPSEDSLLIENFRKVEEKNPEVNCFDYIFGFSTLKQFRSWFYNDSILKACQDARFKLSVYKSADRIVGHSQAVSTREGLVLVKKMELLP